MAANQQGPEEADVKVAVTWIGQYFRSMKRVLALPLAICSVVVARAQTPINVNVGLRVGANAATAKYMGLGRLYNTGYKIGGEAGATALATRGHLVLQASILYARKGFLIDDEYHLPGNLGISRGVVRQTHVLNYLVVPINFAYALRGDGTGIQLFAGGYIGRLLHGTAEYDDLYEVQDPGNPASPTTFTYQQKVDIRPSNEYPLPFPVMANANRHGYSRPFDAGIQAGLGYRHKQIYIQAGYSRGLTDLGPTYPSVSGSRLIGPSYYHRAAYLSFSYLLDLSR